MVGGLIRHPHLGENAMTTAWRFLVKFASLIVCTLHCFDRVIFKGHLALAAPCELEYFVDCVLKVRRTDFMKTRAPQYSDRLVEHAQGWARNAGRTYEYRTGQFRKDEWAQNLIRDQGISEGLVGILCTQETCPSFTLVPGPKRPQFVSRSRQQRVLYYYFLDPQFGLIHVRLQTWLPFTVQVYVNGHEWLAQQMVQKKLGFVQQHNAFTQLDDPAQAQRLADRFAQLKWPRILDRWARQVNPLLRELVPGYPVHWVVDQAEYATDLLFTSRAALAGLYRSLLGYAVRTFTPKDILGFLGRKWDRRFDGEVHTHYEDDRWFGTRIKHRMKTNWLKMYDKFGLILRVETVINSPKEFSVYRTRQHHAGTSSGGYTSGGQELRFFKGLEVERQQGSDRGLVLTLNPFQAFHNRRLEPEEVLVVPARQALLLDELPQPLDQVQVRRVRRQEQQLDPKLLGQLLHHGAALIAGVVQDQRQGQTRVPRRQR